MRRPNWRRPCRRRKVSVSWMCVNSRLDYTLCTMQMSWKQWRRSHVRKVLKFTSLKVSTYMFYTQSLRQGDTTEPLLHRWDANLKGRDGKNGIRTEEKRKWVYEWQCMHVLSWSRLYYVMQLISTSYLNIHHHFVHINNCICTYLTLRNMYNHWNCICLLVCNMKKVVLLYHKLSIFLFSILNISQYKLALKISAFKPTTLLWLVVSEWFCTI